MADIETYDHFGFSVPDVREGVDFWQRVFGAHWDGRYTSASTDELGNAPHTGVMMGTAFMAFFEHLQPLDPPERPRGYAGSRHGFTVRRARFQEAVERLKACSVAFEGPIAHPENSPFGESVYFADPGGNFYEICWRRDREEEWERGSSMAGKV